MKLAILCSTADYSTTSGQDVMLFVEGCWARCEPRNCIRDVPVASKLRTPLTLVSIVFRGTMAIPELNGRFLHNDLTNPESDCGRWLGSIPASQWYRIYLSAISIHEVPRLNRVGYW